MTAVRASSPTLVINTPLVVTFPKYYANVTVVNRNSTGTVWVRTDGANPTVAGDDCFPVLPMSSQTFPNGNLQQEPITRVISGTYVALFSDTACPVTVYGT